MGRYWIIFVLALLSISQVSAASVYLNDNPTISINESDPHFIGWNYNWNNLTNIPGYVRNYSYDIDGVNQTAINKVSPGNCPTGEFVVNTTTGGVQCAVPPTSDLTDYWNEKLQGYLSNVIRMSFNKTAGYSGVEGDLYWDAPDKTLALRGEDWTLQIGQEMYAIVYNDKGYPLLDGHAVRLDGGNSGYMTVEYADSSDVNTGIVLGILTQTIASGETGMVTISGNVNGVNTSDFTPGTILFVDQGGSGELTDIKPICAACYPMTVGFVITQAENGRMFIEPALAEIDPIFANSVAYSIAYNDTLNWNSAYGWGDHALAGYLTQANLSGFYNSSQVDQLISNNSLRIDSLNISKLNTTDQRYNDSLRIDSLNISKLNNGSVANLSFIYTAGINSTGDVRVAEGAYFYGQPILGMLGNGIIDAGSLADREEINVSCTGLNCSYDNFTMRIVSGTGAVAINCFIPNGTFTAVDNQQSVRYVDTSCAVQVAEFSNYFENLIGAGNVWDFSILTCHNAVCEVFRGGSIENRRNIRTRVVSYFTDHLRVLEGMGFTAGGGRNFSISSGKYFYMMSQVNTPLLNTNTSTIEYWYHNGSTTNWSTQELVGGLNLAQCDNGIGLVTCTGTSYRRYYIYVVGWNQTSHYPAELVQTAGLLGTTYTLANCLNTVTNPLITNLPNFYTKTAVSLYAYCGQRTDTTLTIANIIDLRTVKTGSATGSATETDPVWTVASVNYNTIALDWANDTASFSLITEPIASSLGNWSSDKTGIQTDISNRLLNNSYITVANITLNGVAAAKWKIGNYEADGNYSGICYNGTATYIGSSFNITAVGC